MAKGKKYYVVWVGRERGVYHSWAECLLQVKDFPNAKYKSFPTLYEAQDAYMGVPPSSRTKRQAPVSGVERFQRFPQIIRRSISVDAACSGNPGLMEYRGVHTVSGKEIFRLGPFKSGTNNVGEFLALVHGIALLQREKQPTLPIYSDSKIAMGWVKKKKCNTKLQLNKNNASLFQLIARAEKWLRENSYQNPILKWETKQWGEIPADFGRK